MGEKRGALVPLLASRSWKIFPVVLQPTVTYMNGRNQPRDRWLLEGNNGELLSPHIRDPALCASGRVTGSLGWVAQVDHLPRFVPTSKAVSAPFLFLD